MDRVSSFGATVWRVSELNHTSGFSAGGLQHGPLAFTRERDEKESEKEATVFL